MGCCWQNANISPCLYASQVVAGGAEVMTSWRMANGIIQRKTRRGAGHCLDCRRRVGRGAFSVSVDQYQRASLFCCGAAASSTMTSSSSAFRDRSPSTRWGTRSRQADWQCGQKHWHHRRAACHHALFWQLRIIRALIDASWRPCCYCRARHLFISFL